MIITQFKAHPIKTAAPEKKNFINYIHNFRGLAILFVVACHLLLEWPEGSLEYRVLDLLWGNGTVLFVFIAGYLFQHLSKKFNYKTYIIKKVQNVILPYLIISIPIIAFRLISNDNPGYILDQHPDFLNWNAGSKIVYYLTHGAHMQPLWFIPMIIFFYVLAPLFIYIDKHPRLYYLLFVFAAISLLVEREPFSDIPKMFVHFISVYLFGMFMSRYKDNYIEFAKRYWPAITVLTITALVLNYWLYTLYNNPLNYIQKILFCAFFIYWLWRLDNYVPKILGTLADLSFGIFFIHYYFILIIKALYQKFMGEGIPGQVIYWVIDLLLVLLGTIVFLRIVKRVFPKKSRFLVGC